MPSVRCPGCDEKVKVRDDDERVRCTSCGFKFRLDDEDDDDRPMRKSRSKASKPKKTKANKGGFLQQNKEVLITAAAVLAMGFFLLLVSFFLPGIILAPIVAANLIYLYAFVRTCMLATEEGNYISLDYLSFLGGVRFLLIILFLGLYINGYFIMWYVVQVGCAIGKPKKFLPWIGVQVYGIVLLIACIIAGVIGASVQAAIRAR